jgi:LruC domain-containing protein
VATAGPVANLAVSLSDSQSDVQPGQTVVYTLVVTNLGPGSGNGAILRLPAIAGLTVTGIQCGPAIGGAICPPLGNGMSRLQGAGLLLPALPSGGSLTFTLTATISAASGSLTKIATITPAPGSTDPALGNNAASDTDQIRYKLWLPLVRNQPGDSQQWQLMLGYEDLPLAQGNNDYDFNDWVVGVSTTLSYTSGSSGLVRRIDMAFDPQANGGSYDHNFEMRFPAGVFASNGTAVLTHYDQNHNVLDTQTLPLTSSVDNVFDIFPDTLTVFPGPPVNVFETQPGVPPRRFTKLRLTFDTPFALTVSAASLNQPHGQDLFFDPLLLVLNTGDTVHAGDVRLLSVPITNWRWPEENVRIDQAYPLVGYSAGNPPTFIFPASWWRINNHCVYDGVACSPP